MPQCLFRRQPSPVVAALLHELSLNILNKTTEAKEAPEEERTIYISRQTFIRCCGSFSLLFSESDYTLLARFCQMSIFPECGRAALPARKEAAPGKHRYPRYRNY
jgi:hypothetical protein